MLLVKEGLLLKLVSHMMVRRVVTSCHSGLPMKLRIGVWLSGYSDSSKRLWACTQSLSFLVLDIHMLGLIVVVVLVILEELLVELVEVELVVLVVPVMLVTCNPYAMEGTWH